jgi:hypothetical protein
MRSAATRMNKIGKAETRFLTIPAELYRDSNFPFIDEDQLIITIKNDTLIITKKTESAAQRHDHQPER